MGQKYAVPADGHRFAPLQWAALIRRPLHSALTTVIQRAAISGGRCFGVVLARSVMGLLGAAIALMMAALTVG
jgi:hypothetical protein